MSDESGILERDLERAVLATARYYDIFAMPLTVVQIWRYLIARIVWRTVAVNEWEQ